MFDELDKLMHERPLNQMALAAWAMRMHGILKLSVPQLNLLLDDWPAVGASIASLEHLRRIGLWCIAFAEVMTKESDDV